METWELCFNLSGNTTMLKSISKRRLSSELKLATEKERQLTTETLELCFSLSENTTRL